ncbi:hypothetical protein CRP01_13525 [Flavilitoribacter nigricans DSM 23189 = NBRC 102662]|uniref:Outer membrane protein beta-barrel domain-containing protein n=2 Tax=Flavilitoribacter TaxID=2762562 RepID=A0A2D0NBX4_FLAN2|nr:hypothetical protein CRP01_13525 [Flavilitoribacter nigricans DSM 23189 = NBRC 102662]
MLFGTPASAQFTTSSVFLEVGGAAPYYSLNYARTVFTGRYWSGQFRVGAGVLEQTLAVPLGFTLLGGRKDHHPELTMAITPVSEGLRFWDRDQSDFKVDLVLGLCYRFQPARGRFHVSVGGFPYIRLDPTPTRLSEKKPSLGFWPGFSVGRLFK